MKTVILNTMKVRLWECPACGDMQYEEYTVTSNTRKTVSCKHCGNIFKFVLPYNGDNHKVVYADKDVVNTK